jgi:hypothetical protein
MIASPTVLHLQFGAYRVLDFFLGFASFVGSISFVRSISFVGSISYVGSISFMTIIITTEILIDEFRFRPLKNTLSGM